MKNIYPKSFPNENFDLFFGEGGGGEGGVTWKRMVSYGVPIFGARGPVADELDRSTSACILNHFYQFQRDQDAWLKDSRNTHIDLVYLGIHTFLNLLCLRRPQQNMHIIHSIHSTQPP